MKIAIIGYGYVGKAMYQFFHKHYETIVYDPLIAFRKGEVTMVRSYDEVNQCDLGVICVPTPRGENGECDISLVEETIEKLNTPLILLKSTVEVGTTDRLIEKTKKNIVFSPEYCGESSYWTPYKFHTDIKETPFFCFGGAKENTTKIVDIFEPVAGPVKRYIQTDAKTAEMTKYMENCFYATKIAFCYEVYEICQKLGVDYNMAREIWIADPRINPMHTSVFMENDWPFSGKCFPKDMAAFASLARKNGYNADLLEEVLRTNKRIHDIRKERRTKDK